MSRPSFPRIGRSPLILAAALLLLGCRESPGSRLTAVTDDPKPFRLRATARAAWCPAARRLEVTGIREDAGMAVVVYPEDSLVPGSYPVFDPGRSAMQRPGAAGAGRWFLSQEVRGYQSDSGSVELSRTAGTFSMRFVFRLVSVTLQDTVRISGRVNQFTPGLCQSDTTPSSPDSE